ncbi:hypothetical protein SCLARK_00658 [Spiroplasma clarkii]|uniref:Lipoprotein n=1 Tax=Spiroplasma clarkii TaxID=2139 RepID=A0A1Y0L016_9MOLU|nr:lipoprotein [Spiroplasma clarkii]ARU91321.1 hypothetical protein SCLARK_00658 [Spiroplasma clarkii]ATX70745.1 hypothetical protein SCLAR_v1c04210 [Spiroplasma clarkii]
MKKLLAIFGVFSMVTTASTSVLACNSDLTTLDADSIKNPSNKAELLKLLKANKNLNAELKATALELVQSGQVDNVEALFDDEGLQSNEKFQKFVLDGAKLYVLGVKTFQYLDSVNLVMAGKFLLENYSLLLNFLDISGLNVSDIKYFLKAILRDVELTRELIMEYKSLAQKTIDTYSKLLDWALENKF